MPNSPRRDADDGAAVVRPLRVSDLARVLQIESRSFPSPWRREHFEHELHGNRFAQNLALVRGDELIGYACFWVIAGELKLNNIAVDPAERGRGYGALLLRGVLRHGARLGCRLATLEVRRTNDVARAMYRAHGFLETGRRRNYYALEGEDAILMERELAPTAGIAADRDREL